MGLKVDKNRFFRRLTLRIAGCMDMDTAVNRCLDTLSDILPVDIMTFHSYVPETGILETLAVADQNLTLNQFDPIIMSLEQRKVIQEKWSTRVWRIPQLGKDPLTALAATLLGLETTAAMLMDLTLEQQFTGVVVVANHQGYTYTQEDANLLTILNEPLAIALSNCIRFKEVQDLKEMLALDNERLKKQLSDMVSQSLIGAESGLKEVIGQIQRVADLDSPVLLLGETGTGKEMIARALHNQSNRKEGPFIPVNCGALPQNLVDSELFGHEKGAFTGALHQHQGRFEQANGGSIFLDEIGELPPRVQVRLLRVIQEKEIHRVGGKGSIPLDVRIIAATHRDIPEMLAQGKFREDLYFRLSVFPILIPALRQRRQDIPALAQYFLKTKALSMNHLPIPLIPDHTWKWMAQYHWPGNVRELENLIERALILHDSGPLNVEPLSLIPAQSHAGPSVLAQAIQTLDQVNARHIKRVLAVTQGRVEGDGGAAQVLDIHPSTLRKRMQKLNIPYGKRAE